MDHINGDPLDNRWENLREATASENSANRRARVYHGHKWAHDNGFGRWVSLIRIGDKQKYLGTFDTPQEASDAAFSVAQSIHGAFARR